MSAMTGDWYASVGTHDRNPCPDDADTVRWVYSTQPNGDKYVVAKVWSGDDGDYAGTARLVAAAPNLLQELRWLVATLESAWNAKELTAPQYVQCQLGTQVKHCLAAIAKAEGRTK